MAGLLAQERVTRVRVRQPALDQLLHGHVGLGHHVLQALAVHREGAHPAEILQRHRPGFGDEVGGERETLLLVVVHGQSFQSQAAPRTPLESPCAAGRIGV